MEVHTANWYNSKSQRPKVDLRQVTRDWLKSVRWHFPIAVTVTLRQTYPIHTPVATRHIKLTRQDAEHAAQRFIMKLNREVFGVRAAEKYGKKLSYLPVLEGANGHKNMHLHFAIGGLPNHVNYLQMKSLIINAIQKVPLFDEQHFETLADRDWITYITKEITSMDTDAVLWHLAC